MTLRTQVRIIGSHISPEGLFAKCRELIGIPDNQPITSSPDCCGWTRTDSTPGGFDAALTVFTHPDGPADLGHRFHDELCDPYCGCLGATPDCDLAVDFGTTYGYRGTHGGCEDLHRHLTAELGKWVESLGGDWWALDEFHGDWWHRTPAPVGMTIRRLNAGS